MAQDPFFVDLRNKRDEYLNNCMYVSSLKRILNNNIKGPNEIVIETKDIFLKEVSEEEFLESPVAEWLTRNGIRYKVLHDKTLKLYIYFHNI